MNLGARIDKNKLIIFDLTNGSIRRTISLPSGADYSGPIVSGDYVTVSIHLKNGNNRARTYNLKSGSLKSDILM